MKFFSIIFFVFDATEASFLPMNAVRASVQSFCDALAKYPKLFTTGDCSESAET